MKKILLASLILGGCAIPVKNVPNDIELNDVTKVINNQGEMLKQHASILDAIGNYIKTLQDTNVLPKPKVEVKK